MLWAVTVICCASVGHLLPTRRGVLNPSSTYDRCSSYTSMAAVDGEKWTWDKKGFWSSSVLEQVDPALKTGRDSTDWIRFGNHSISKGAHRRSITVTPAPLLTALKELLTLATECVILEVDGSLLSTHFYIHQPNTNANEKVDITGSLWSSDCFKSIAVAYMKSIGNNCLL